MQPLFPIFVPTLSRYDSRLTIKALQRMNIERWYAVVEPQEYDFYAACIPAANILVLDLEYKKKYETLDGLGETKSVGPGAARNFAWDTAVKMGYPWHWVMDDNIRRFYRINNNVKSEVLSGSFFRIMEDFCVRYENIAMAGPQYEKFTPRKAKRPPFMTNTRIYSCNLIRNDIPYHWRGRYNEDTILSIDVLRNGWCTVQFYSYVQEKVTTQTVKGGCDKVFYSKEGTYAKSKMLVDVYPQYAKLKYKFSRVHHEVDYSPFFKNKLKLKDGVDLQNLQPNEYGMELTQVRPLRRSSGDLQHLVQARQ